MGVFDKFLDIMKLNDDDYDDDFYDEEDEYFDDEEFDEKPARRSLFGKKNTKEESFDDFDMEEEKKFQPASSSKVTPMRHPGNTECERKILIQIWEAAILRKISIFWKSVLLNYPEMHIKEILSHTLIF